MIYSCGPPHMANQKQEDQLEHPYSSYVMIRDVTLKTCRRRWMIGRRGERGSGISVLAARHDDYDDDDVYRAGLFINDWINTFFYIFNEKFVKNRSYEVIFIRKDKNSLSVNILKYLYYNKVYAFSLVVCIVLILLRNGVGVKICVWMCHYVGV